MDCDHLEQKWLNRCHRRPCPDRQVSEHPRERSQCPGSGGLTGASWLWWCLRCSRARPAAVLRFLCLAASLCRACAGLLGSALPPGCRTSGALWLSGAAASLLSCFPSPCCPLLATPIGLADSCPDLTVEHPCPVRLPGQCRCDQLFSPGEAQVSQKPRWELACCSCRPVRVKPLNGYLCVILFLMAFTLKHVPGTSQRWTGWKKKAVDSSQL